MMTQASSHDPQRMLWAAYVVMASLLLMATLAWHIPMMLWDHLDLLPILQAWRDGSLQSSQALAMHDGSHMHAAAYAVLLVTTTLSGGQTWLDCVVSWGLLLACAAIILARSRDLVSVQTPRWQSLTLVFLALYPGHLANLQWGWQVAVFLCLLGSITAIAALSATTLSWPKNLLAMAGALLAWLGFATSLALVPVAVLLITLRTNVAWSRKIAMVLPWFALGALALIQVLVLPSSTTLSAAIDPVALAHYALNVIGSGALRFATDLAAWLAVAAIAVAIHAFLVMPSEQRASAWLGLFLFGIFAAVLTATGRVAAHGVDHAFAQRYVSFSSLFWLGWVGMLIQASTSSPRWRRTYTGMMAIAAVLLLANALHLVKKAAITGERTRETAALIADSWPDVDDRVLDEAYFGRTSQARERLAMLRRSCFAPFERSATAGCN